MHPRSYRDGESGVIRRGLDLLIPQRTIQDDLRIIPFRRETALLKFASRSFSEKIS